MSDPGVSLIPRGSKSTKKKRASFRPASKKSNQNKSKASTASSAKTSKVISPGNKIQQSAETANVAASKLLAETHPAPTAAAVVGEGAAAATAATSKNDGDSKPLSPSAESSISKSLSKGGSGREDEVASENHATTTTEKNGSKESISPRTTRTSRTIPTRKRKANSLNKKINIGSSFRRKTENPDDESSSPMGKDRKNDAGNNEKLESTSTAIVPLPMHEDTHEGKENDPKASALEAKKVALTVAIQTVSSNIPAFSAHDQAILNQLASEDKQEENKSLNAFCTPFKGPKRRLKEKKDGANNDASTNSDNNRGKKDGKDSGKGVADSSADKSSKTNSQVDATTAGAPSVQIIDGQIVLQEASVMLPSRRTVQEVEEEFQGNVVEEDEQLNIVQASYTSFITKGDHGKTRKKGTWTIKETEKFYHALQQLGTDFGSMEALFFENERTRKQLKNKYRKELAKNPDLVEELALNPKYQTQIDITALNLVVDPKRIEAHENEEPPAYEPTDGEGIENVTPTKSNSKVKLNENGRDYNGVFDGEVVEEDAEEERRAEALAKLEEKKPTSIISETKDHKDSSFWSTRREDQHESDLGIGAGSNMDGFPQESGEGPSMDDFFGDAYVDGDDDDPVVDEGNEKETSALEITKKEEVPVAKSETSELVSLVPKKTNSKSRRPKIRPSRRKK